MACFTQWRDAGVGMAATCFAMASACQAQAPPIARPHCTMSPPFALTDANQLKATALRKRVGDKTIVYTRLQTGANFEGGVSYRIQLRADGSLRMRCEQKAASAERWSPCRGLNESNPRARDRDVGVWRVEGGDLVLQRTALEALGREEARVALHEANGMFAARGVRGPHFCLPGPIGIE